MTGRRKNGHTAHDDRADNGNGTMETENPE